MNRGATAEDSALPGWIRRRVPRSPMGWTLLALAVVGWVIVLATMISVLSPLWTDSNTLGGHDWDQMEAHRYLVQKTILRFHEFPFWNPYACGGHTTWGGFESGTIVVSPWLPFYLTMSLPHAMRVEIVGSTLIALLGAWLLAGRFSRSPAVRALVAIAFALNGRWTLQLAAGHTWHLVYALTPWVLYFFDRAVAVDRTLGTGRLRDVVYCGACLAAMVYAGGIYPLPQTIVVLAVYGVILAATTHSLRPIAVGLLAGLISFGLSAPKLLPILEVIGRYPRLVDSPETNDLVAFVAILTSKEQEMTSGHAGVTQWGWHEWGMYVGWGLVVLVLVGALFARGVRETPLKWTALLLLVLGFGAFDPHAPWPLLHHWLPIFRSQHVPSRWMYVALLLLLLVTASLCEGILRRAGLFRLLAEIALLLPVAWIARDMVPIVRQPLMHAFVTKMPATIESLGPFRTETRLPPQLMYAWDYAPLSLPAEMANIGTIACGTFPGLNVYIRDKNGHVPGLGAHGLDDPAYKGEAFVADGVGEARITRWTPNSVTVRVIGARPGEHLVLNQNWDAGWKANGRRAIDWADQVAIDLRHSNEDVVFRYRPRTWWLGVFLFLLTVGSLAWAYLLARKVERVRHGALATMLGASLDAAARC
jgi:hypothetical protein